MFKIKIDVNTYTEVAVSAALGDGGYAGKCDFVDRPDMCTCVLTVPDDELDYFMQTVQSLIEYNIPFSYIKD